MSRVKRLAEDLQTLQAVEDHVTNKAEVVRLLGELERDSAVQSVVATGADGAAAEEVVVPAQQIESTQSGTLQELPEIHPVAVRSRVV